MNIDTTMVIFLTDDGLSLQIDGQHAGYYKNGHIRLFTGTDKSKMPEKVVLHDQRSKK